MPTPHTDPKTTCGIVLDSRTSDILIRVATNHRNVRALGGIPSRSLVIRAALRVLDRALMEKPWKTQDALVDALLDDRFDADTQVMRNQARADYRHAQEALWEARRDLEACRAKGLPNETISRAAEAEARAQTEFERARAEAQAQGVLPKTRAQGAA